MRLARLLVGVSLLCGFPVSSIADDTNTDRQRIWLNEAMQPVQGSDNKVYYTDIPYPPVEGEMEGEPSSSQRFQRRIYYADGNLFRESQASGPDLSGISNGPFRDFAEDGTLLAEGERRNARLHGTLRRYSRTGALRAELNYHMGQAHGAHRNIHPETGILRSEVHYEHGQIVDGTYEVRDDQGRLERRYRREDGKLHGADEYFHEGVLVRRQHYEAGQRHGLYESFHNDGTPRDRYTLVNGQRRGDSKSWHANGKLRVHQRVDDDGEMVQQDVFRDDGSPERAMRITQFEDGSALHVSRRFSPEGTPTYIEAEHRQKDETLTTVRWQRRADGEVHTRTQLLTPHLDIHALRIVMNRYSDGTVGDYQREIQPSRGERWRRDGPHRETTFQNWVQESHYVTGALHGPYQLRDNHGIVISRGEYRRDQRHGEWLERDRVDDRITHITYQDGKRHGAYRIEAEQDDGTFQVMEIGHYQAGLLHGNLQRFDETGKLVGDMTYHEGGLHGTMFDTDRDGDTHHAEYVSGDRHGPYRRLQPAGYPLKIGQYRNGLREGRFYRFARDGALLSVTDYEENRIVDAHYPERDHY